LIADKGSIEKMDELKAKKKHAYLDLDKAQYKMLIIDEVEKELIESVDKVENDLMEIEMLLG